MQRVLFVCMGNICRSPAAEGALLRLVEDGGLGHLVEVDSAGTIDHHTGQLADARMRRAAADRGFDLVSRARPAVVEDFRRFDLIVAMDRDNLADLEGLAERTSGGLEAARGELRLLGDFLPLGSLEEVPDPYFGGAAGFETVLDMVEQAAPAILEHLLEGDPESAGTFGSASP